MHLLMGFVLPIAIVGSPAPATVHADTLDIREWKVPWENTRPRDPYVDGQGRVWFVGQRGDYVAYLQPASGDFRRFELPQGAGPHNLIVDTDGDVWYAGNRAAHIGRMDPNTGEITRFDMPKPEARDPHTLIFDGAGNIWFTLQGANMVGRLNKASGEISLVDIPERGSRPYGIVVDSRNRPWFNLFGTNKIGTIDPATMQLREYTLPQADARTRRLAVTSDDRVWFVDYARGTLGVLDPVNGRVQDWQTPGGANSRPYAMTVDERDRLWLAESGSQPNMLVGFDPRTSSFINATPVPSGAGTIRHMVYHAQSGQIWFGTDSNTVGRAAVR